MVLCYTIQYAPIKLSFLPKQETGTGWQNPFSPAAQLGCSSGALHRTDLSEYTLELSCRTKQVPWMWASTSMWWEKLGNFGWEHGAVRVLVWTASAPSRGSCKIWLDFGDSSAPVLCHNNIRAHPAPLGPISVCRITSPLIFFPHPLPPVSRWKAKSIARLMKHPFPCWALTGVCRLCF